MVGILEAEAHAVANSTTPWDDYGTSFAPPGATHGRRRPSDAARAALRVALALVVAASMLSFASGPCVYATTLYWSYVRSFVAGWWGVHGEMVDPTFVALACAVPLAAGVVAVELLRRLKPSRRRRRRRHLWAMAVSSQLRRRPQLFAGRWVCWFSYGELLLLLALLGGNGVVFWHNYARKYASLLARQPSASFPRVKTFGRSMGYNCIFNMVFLFLPASRNSSWMEFLNVSYANAVRYHRWLGVASVLTALIHCGCYYWCWAATGEWQRRALPCWHCSWTDRVGRQVWVNVFGELALVCFLLISLTSLPAVRRRLYNVFYSVHHLFLVAVAFTVLHWGSAAWFLMSSFVAYLASRAISQQNAVGAAPVRILQAAKLGDRLCKIVLALDDRGEDFAAGQFVYLNAPLVSRLQWHPFTIASAPGDQTVTLVVKALGDWTDQFVQHVHECMRRQIAPTVHVDGFYGASLREAARPYDRLVLVGGGIGVTPLLALLEDLAAAHTSVTSTEGHQRDIHFIFCFREIQLLTEAAPLLRQLQRSSARFRASLFWTRATAVDCEVPISRTTFADTWPSLLLRKTQPPRTGARPFVPALGPAQRGAATVAALTTASLMLAALEFDWGASNTSWWTLGGSNVWIVQRLAQLTALFFSAAVVYALGACGRVRGSSQWPRRAASVRAPDGYGGLLDAGDRLHERLLPSRPDEEPFAHKVDELRIDAVLEEFDVRLGEHPDLAGLLRLDHQREASSYHDLPEFVDYRRRLPSTNTRRPSAPIGVFVSGPGDLKSAVHYAVAALGSRHFDVHTEEFEL